LELCQIARQLNAMFGIQITMEIGAYLILIIRLCNYIFIHIKTNGRFINSKFNWLSLYYWLFLHVAKIFFLNYMCETVSAKVNFHIFHISYVYTNIYIRLLIINFSPMKSKE